MKNRQVIDIWRSARQQVRAREAKSLAHVTFNFFAAAHPNIIQDATATAAAKILRETIMPPLAKSLQQAGGIPLTLDYTSAGFDTTKLAQAFTEAETIIDESSAHIHDPQQQVIIFADGSAIFVYEDINAHHKALTSLGFAIFEPNDLVTLLDFQRGGRPLNMH